MIHQRTLFILLLLKCKNLNPASVKSELYPVVCRMISTSLPCPPAEPASLCLGPRGYRTNAGHGYSPIQRPIINQGFRLFLSLLPKIFLPSRPKMLFCSYPSWLNEYSEKILRIRRPIFQQLFSIDIIMCGLSSPFIFFYRADEEVNFM